MSSLRPRVHFVTGVTGFVGAAFTLELLRANPKDRVFCLVRAGDDAVATRRAHGALIAAADAYDVPNAELESALARAFAMRGDLTAPFLGLGEGQRARLATVGPLHVWHCAASLKDDEESLREILAHNVAGVERVLVTLLALDVAVFNHVSTAYVAGRTRGDVLEGTDRPRGFSNRYEQSKHYGEQLVVDHCEARRVPYRILRPGIVIAHSVTCRATGYTGFLGWALKVAALDEATGGALHKLPLRYVARGEVPLNVIPVDSVAEDMVGIDAAGVRTHERVFHLTNTQPPTIRWMLDAVTDALGLRRVELVAGEDALDPISRRFHRWTRFERPYVATNKLFSRASNELYDSPRHGNCPLTEDGLAAMVRHAVAEYRRMRKNESRGVA